MSINYKFNSKYEYKWVVNQFWSLGNHVSRLIVYGSDIWEEWVEINDTAFH